MNYFTAHLKSVYPYVDVSCCPPPQAVAGAIRTVEPSFGRSIKGTQDRPEHDASIALDQLTTAYLPLRECILKAPTKES